MGSASEGLRPAMARLSVYERFIVSFTRGRRGTPSPPPFFIKPPYAAEIKIQLLETIKHTIMNNLECIKSYLELRIDSIKQHESSSVSAYFVGYDEGGIAELSFLLNILNKEEK